MIFTIKNKSGAFIEVLNYGCRIRRICVPDREGYLRNVCLGYENPSAYQHDTEYYGAVVGRCCNLISNAGFHLNNTHYSLAANAGAHHLHGGPNGFSFLNWDTVKQGNKLIFRRLIPDLSDGYPGNLQMKVTYEWTENNCLNIYYEGNCDADTVLNVTNHTYFNLTGTGKAFSSNKDVLQHELCIHADYITEVNEELLPTGNFLPVPETCYDFHSLRPISQEYDHNFVLNGQGFRKAAVLQSPESGIRMTCYTVQPGIQLYTAGGICLETQHFTDAVHIPEFPSVILKAGETFVSQTSYCFDTF